MATVGSAAAGQGHIVVLERHSGQEVEAPPVLVHVVGVVRAQPQFAGVVAVLLAVGGVVQSANEAVAGTEIPPPVATELKAPPLTLTSKLKVEAVWGLPRLTHCTLTVPASSSPWSGAKKPMDWVRSVFATTAFEESDHQAGRALSIVALRA